MAYSKVDAAPARVDSAQQHSFAEFPPSMVRSLGSNVLPTVSLQHTERAVRVLVPKRLGGTWFLLPQDLESLPEGESEEVPRIWWLEAGFQETGSPLARPSVGLVRAGVVIRGTKNLLHVLQSFSEAGSSATGPKLLISARDYDDYRARLLGLRSDGTQLDAWANIGLAEKTGLVRMDGTGPYREMVPFSPPEWLTKASTRGQGIEESFPHDPRLVPAPMTWSTKISSGDAPERVLRVLEVQFKDRKAQDQFWSDLCLHGVVKTTSSYGLRSEPTSRSDSPSASSSLDATGHCVIVETQYWVLFKPAP